MSVNNEMAFDTDLDYFMIGGERLYLPTEGHVEISVKSVEIEESTVLLLDQNGMTVGNVRVRLEAVIPNTGSLDSPWTKVWLGEVDADGILKVRFLANENGHIALSVRDFGLNGNLFHGSMRLNGRDLGNGKENATEFRLTRVPLSLIVNTKWDPAYSDAAFKPNVSGAAHRYIISLNGFPESRTLMSPTGEARFYGVSPGRYQLQLSDSGNKIYRISRGTENVLVGEPVAVPVVHTVTLEPAKSQLIDGCVLEDAAGKPLAGVTVTAGEEGTVTDANGNFSVTVRSAGPGAAVLLQHRGYYPLEINTQVLVPQRGYVWSMKSLPVIRGKVLWEDGNGVVESATMKFSSGMRKEKVRCGREGSYEARLAPAEYQVRIEAPIRVGDGGATQSLSAILYDGTLVVQEEVPGGLERDFTVAKPVRVNLKIDLAAAISPLPRSARLAFFRQGDGSYYTSQALSGDLGALRTVFLQEGRYWAVVARSEREGFTRQLSVKEGMDLPVVLSVDKLTRFEHNKDGSLKFDKAGE